MMSSSHGETNLTDHGNRNPRSGRRRAKASQVVSLRNPGGNTKSKKFTMGTWNVRTMLKAGKLEEVKEQMKKANLNILGVCETRWAGNGDFTSEEFRIIHSGNETRGRSGVALILKGEWKDSVLNTYHLSDRILMIKLEAIPNNIYIIQVYFPTSSSTEEEIDSIYEQIEDLLQLTDEKSNVFIMGDFNASVGNQTGTNTDGSSSFSPSSTHVRLVVYHPTVTKKLLKMELAEK
ncbi:hypothetical protein M8J75_015140 [Diaphorina citri]|nr:hypothetical protein M8J75_015140 [Diaphorina citri]